MTVADLALQQGAYLLAYLPACLRLPTPAQHAYKSLVCDQNHAASRISVF